LLKYFAPKPGNLDLGKITISTDNAVVMKGEAQTETIRPESRQLPLVESQAVPKVVGEVLVSADEDENEMEVDDAEFEKGEVDLNVITSSDSRPLIVSEALASMDKEDTVDIDVIGEVDADAVTPETRHQALEPETSPADVRKAEASAGTEDITGIDYSDELLLGEADADAITPETQHVLEPQTLPLAVDEAEPSMDKEGTGDAETAEAREVLEPDNRGAVVMPVDRDTTMETDDAEVMKAEADLTILTPEALHAVEPQMLPANANVTESAVDKEGVMDTNAPDAMMGENDVDAITPEIRQVSEPQALPVVADEVLASVDKETAKDIAVTKVKKGEVELNAVTPETRQVLEPHTLPNVVDDTKAVREGVTSAGKETRNAGVEQQIQHTSFTPNLHEKEEGSSENTEPDSVNQLLGVEGNVDAASSDEIKPANETSDKSNDEVPEQQQLTDTVISESNAEDVVADIKSTSVGKIAEIPDTSTTSESESDENAEKRKSRNAA